MALTPDAQGYYRPPGPQNVGKYPMVGPNYRKYGEVQGYVYNPWSDTYKPDPKVAKEYAYQTGLAERPPEPPSLSDTLVPIAGVGAALAGGRYLGENIGDIGSGLLSAGKNALGYGAETTAATAAEGGASALAAGAPEAIGTAANGGTLMADGTIVGGEGAGLLAPGSAASTALGAAGVGLGGWQAYEGVKEGNPLQAGLGGAGVGLGLNTLGYSLGPWGWAAAAGIPVVASLLGGFGDKDAWKTEGDRLRKLQDQGIPLPAGLLESMPTGGRSKEELIKIAQQTGGNVKFAESRNEADLTPQDLVGYATVIEQAHKTGQNPLDLAQQALAAGAVREHHGTIDIDWSKVGQPQPGLLQPAPANTPTNPPPIQRPVTNAGLLSTRT